jgi:hypothetical protein
LKQTVATVHNIQKSNAPCSGRDSKEQHGFSLVNQAVIVALSATFAIRRTKISQFLMQTATMHTATFMSGRGHYLHTQLDAVPARIS